MSRCLLTTPVTTRARTQLAPRAVARLGPRAAARLAPRAAAQLAPRVTPSPASGAAGFTLLEVMAAFAIAAISLAVLYRGSIDGLTGARLAERTGEAVARARSRLAATCHGARLTVGEQSGDDGAGFAWRTAIARAETAVIDRGTPDQPVPPIRADLFAVRVSISWPGTVRPHEVALETRCLSTGPADRP